MTKIILQTDCGNSPKREFLKDLTIAFAKYDLKFISSSLSDDVQWTLIGDQKVEGKVAFLKSLKEMQDVKTAELQIQHISTHGKEGAINGEMILENGQKYAFCDVYEFTNTRGTMVKSIDSYVIELKG